MGVFWDQFGIYIKTNNNNLMFDRILGPKIPVASTQFITELESIMKKNEGFFTIIEKWRNLQISYMGKLAQLQCDVTDKDRSHKDENTNQLNTFFELLINNHKILINKLNHDIFLANIQSSKPTFAQQKSIIESEKNIHRQIASKKQIFEKVLIKKSKLKKQLGEEQTLQIFSQDSYEEGLDKRIKRCMKIKEISKEQDLFEIKVKETKEIFEKIIQESQANIQKFNKLTAALNNQKDDILMKINLHILNYGKSLVSDFQENCKQLNDKPFIQCKSHYITNHYICQEEQNIRDMDPFKHSYLDNCFRLISEKAIDQIIEYSKDNEIKKKIKKIVESDSINPEDTDQLTRQVQLVKKILSSNCSSPQCLNNFKSIIKKNSKFRLNFIFMLQFNRLNNKFQIKKTQVKPVFMLINELLAVAHQARDAFVIKQLMVLLSTYYIKIDEGGHESKVYILNFFKNCSFWRDIQLWESILIQCIYIEKKATIRMLLITSSASNRSQLVQAQKTSVLNQILYIVRNMLLFDFTEKEVKQFANRFVKMMKQDDRFLKDVHRSIENAIREEKEAMPTQYSVKQVEEIKLQIFGTEETQQKNLKVQSSIM